MLSHFFTDGNAVAPSAAYINITHAKLAKCLRCSERAVSAAVRELARTGLLPLVGVTPGKHGRASRFLFICDPFTWADKQDDEAERIRARRHPRTIDEQVQASRAHESGEISAERLAELERAARLKRDWLLPPRESRVTRFRRPFART